MFNHRFDEIEKQTKGIVFNIEHFHVHDGEGIRTNVFLKGCSLHCPWCCNPESIHPVPQIAQYQKLCTGCGKCVEVCPEHCCIQMEMLLQISANAAPAENVRQSARQGPESCSGKG